MTANKQEITVMTRRYFYLILTIGILAFSQPGLCREAAAPATSTTKPVMLSVDEILKHLEKHYASTGFSANFFQTSRVKAMDMTETASGAMVVKRPGMMRWTYEQPDRHLIITDGRQLWIYHPSDNQVTVGKAPPFFGDGKGASFLSNIQLVRKQFDVSQEKMTVNQEYVLKLVPRDKSYDLSYVLIVISSDTFDIVDVKTFNSYGDETHIELSNIRMEQNIDDAQFKFVIPPGTEVVRMDG